MLDNQSEEEGEAGQSRHRRVRLAIRRWRLRWRFALRSLRYRRPLRRLRLLRDPDGDVAFRRIQLTLGRLAGRVYARGVNTGERARIARARLPDRTEPVRTAVALVRLQRSLIATLLALIAVGLALDITVCRFGPDLASALGIENWLRDTFTRPHDDTLRNLLAAAAGGSATILGLVLSISLIVWQTTAERYRSTTIVGFLLRERIGAAVVRLLALGFAYSLWVLAILEVAGQRPYISAGLALALSTAAVLSLLGYRETGLLGYHPSSIADGLRREISREEIRAARRGAGRSVADYSRRVVAADLQIFDDLIRRLLTEGDAGDVAACVTELGRALSWHVRLKPTHHPESPFFERHKKRLTGESFDVEESIVRKGLMNPTTEVPDHYWVERRVLSIGRRVTDSEVFLTPEVTESVIGLWAEALQYAWYVEDHDSLVLILEEVERVAADPRILEHPDLVEHLLTVAWLVIEAVGTGVRTTAEAIVDSEPWRTSEPVGLFPWRAKEDARELGQRVRREIAIADRVVSPRSSLVADVESRRAPRLREQQRRLTEWAVALCSDVLTRAADERSASAPRAAKMTLRAVLRLVHRDLDMPDFERHVVGLKNAIALAREEDAEDLRVDAGRAARVFAERERWTAAYGALEVAAGAGLLARVRETDERHNLVLLFDTLFTAAAVYGWGEFHRQSDHLDATARYVQRPFADLNIVHDALDNHLLHQLMLPVIVYQTWFQPLIQAVYGLPDRPVEGAGRGFITEKDHPSPLIARAGMGLLFGPDECLESLVGRTVEARDDERARLVATLRLVNEIHGDDPAT
jgi:hypothetical protein